MDVLIVILALTVIPVVILLGFVRLVFRAMRNPVVRTAVLVATAGDQRRR